MILISDGFTKAQVQKSPALNGSQDKQIMTYKIALQLVMLEDLIGSMKNAPKQNILSVNQK